MMMRPFRPAAGCWVRARFALRLRGRDVVEGPAGRQAFEIEFAPKGTDRLRRIVDAYGLGSPYRETVFMVKSAALGRRIQRLANRRATLPASFNTPLPALHVTPWPALPAEQQAALSRALA